jgi:hypothetical protein
MLLATPPGEQHDIRNPYKRESRANEFIVVLQPSAALRETSDVAFLSKADNGLM